MLRASQVGRPPSVRIERASDIGDEAWLEISQILAPGLAVRADRPLTIPLARFLSERRQLFAVCQSRGIGISFDDQLRTLLVRIRNEEQIVVELLRASPAASDAQPPSESRFRRELTWFQRRDYGKLIKLPHGANFSVPGSGKTTVAYAIYETERVRSRVQQLLVVAPLSAFEAWEVEAQECFSVPLSIQRFTGEYPSSRAEILLINYHRLPASLGQVADWCTRKPTHVILDEAHRMKRGRPGVWSSACLDVSLLATRRDLLTGTPAPNRPSDLVALLDYLWPRPGGRRILPEQALWANPPDWAMRAINDRIRPLFARTTKSELDLPNVLFRVAPIEMGELQQAIYAALLRQYSGMLDLSRRDAAAMGRMGEIAMYLLQAACNPKLLSKSSSVGIPYAFPPAPLAANSRLAALIEEATYSKHEMPAKWIALAKILHENRKKERKTLVWSNFPENLLDLEGQLALLRPAVIYGGVPSLADGVPAGTRTREGELARFREDGDCWVLLANPQAMAEGISLHKTCHDAVYIDRTFNAGQYLQSLDRIHRLGLDPGQETRVTFLVSSNSIDETVDRRVTEKATRLAQMLNDPDLIEMALPDDDDYGFALDTEADLVALFEHLAGDQRFTGE